eukprot:TRINITY_DN863_c0_g1_i2.p6 TRINITY_DN863_c0_g1~~TRINITY_DN863_c0_g1_i2.p6  ORF type:complete len:105 (+),score=45.04 TRINITY_DN863_c0_g1_i2:569-883(+)
MVKKTARATAFPTSALRRSLRDGRYCKRVSKNATQFLAAVLEYSTLELLDICSKMAAKKKVKVLSPRLLMLAVRGDDELSKLFHGVTIAGAGVAPHIHGAVATK